MNYIELLYKTRGENWKPPTKLMALDPGMTTGLAYFIMGHPVSIEQIVLESESRGWDPLVDRIDQLMPQVIIYEDYKIYPGKMKAHNFSDIPTLKIIGAIEFVCAHYKMKVIKQLASTGKGFVTDTKLKEWGYYLKGRPHAMDALRHGLHALLFNKGL